MSSNGKAKALFGSAGGSHPLARFTDQRETYGPQVVEELVRKLGDLQVVVDLGAGSGRDLEIVRRLNPNAKLIAVEGGTEYATSFSREGRCNSGRPILNATIYRSRMVRRT